MAFDNYKREFVGIPETAPPSIAMLPEYAPPGHILIPSGDYTFNREGRLVPIDSPEAVSYIVPAGMRVSFDGLTRQHFAGNYVHEFIASESDPEDDSLADLDDEDLDTDGLESEDVDDDTDLTDEEADEDETCPHGFDTDEDCPECDGEDGEDLEEWDDEDLEDMDDDL